MWDGEDTKAVLISLLVCALVYHCHPYMILIFVKCFFFNLFASFVLRIQVVDLPNEYMYPAA